tara:strand:- start:183 stop:890 length:708 start_codon:yes stop_codon:yes gene_type:complete
MINEDAPTMSAGNGGFTGSAAATGPVAGFDPLLGSKKVKKRKYGTKKDVKEAKVDKKLPDHKRATARDKRYGNPHGSHELGGGIRKDRRADHEARRGVKEEIIDERLGGKGYSKKATGGGGDWEDSDRGEGNKAKRRAGQKVKVKSPTYIAHVKNKNVKEGREERSGKDNYLPFKVCYDDAEPYVLYGRSVAEIKIQLRKIYRPEMHKKIYVKRLYPNEVIKMYYDLRMRALANQ